MRIYVVDSDASALRNTYQLISNALPDDVDATISLFCSLEEFAHATEATQPDMIFSELCFDSMIGMQTVHYLDYLAPAVPKAILTNHTDEGFVTLLWHHGVYFLKPKEGLTQASVKAMIAAMKHPERMIFSLGQLEDKVPSWPCHGKKMTRQEYLEFKQEQLERDAHLRLIQFEVADYIDIHKLHGDIFIFLLMNRLVVLINAHLGESDVVAASAMGVIDVLVHTSSPEAFIEHIKTQLEDDITLSYMGMTAHVPIKLNGFTKKEKTSSTA